MNSNFSGSAKAGGVFHYTHVRNGAVIDEWDSHNLVVDQGLNHMLDVVLHGTAAVSPWYVGVFEGNYTPVAGDTAATFPTNSTECTAYTEATRQEYVEAAAAAKVTTNSASRATFTFNAAKTIYGAFLASASAKSAATGTLLAADRAATAKVVASGDQLMVTYSITMAAA